MNCTRNTVSIRILIMGLSVVMLTASVAFADCEGQNVVKECQDMFKDAAKDLWKNPNDGSNSEERANTVGSALKDCANCAWDSITKGVSDIDANAGMSTTDPGYDRTSPVGRFGAVGYWFRS